MSKLVVGSIFAKYKTLEEAVSEAHNGDTIVIKKRTVLEHGLTIDRSLLFVGQGAVIATPKNQAAFYLINNANLEITGINFEVPGQSQAISAEAGYQGSIALSNGSMVHIGKLTEREYFPSLLLVGSKDNPTAAALILDGYSVDYLSVAVRSLEIDNNAVIGELNTPNQSQLFAVTNDDAFRINHSLLMRVVIGGGPQWHMVENTFIGGVQLQASAQLVQPTLMYSPSRWKPLLKEPVTSTFLNPLKFRTQHWRDRAPLTDMDYVLSVAGNDVNVKISRPAFYAETPFPLQNQAWFNFLNASVTILGGTIENAALPSVVSGGGLDLENVLDHNHWSLDQQNQPELANGGSKSSLFKESVTQVTQTANQQSNGYGALKTLDSMIGLESVKKAAHDLVAQAEVSRARRAKGAGADESMALHTVFLGNAGTGKTTVAKILAQALYEHKVLATNKFTRVTSKDLISEYVGKTPQKTHEQIMKALDGVLLIDEAYTLTADPSNKLASYAAESIATIVDDAEEYQDRLMIIMAGYTTDMQHMFAVSNQGLKSRFARRITFEDYSPAELCKILVYRLKGGHVLPANKNTMVAAAKGLLAGGYYRDRAAGNGRFVREYVNALKSARDARLRSSAGSHLNDMSLQQLETFTSDDVQNAQNVMATNAQAFMTKN